MTTRAGYTFEGWYNEADEQVTGIQTVPAGGALYTAHWQAEDQTITFDINGGDEATQPEDIVAPTDSDVHLNEVADPTREGYTFVGWYDETGVPFEETIVMPAGGLRLIAHWEELTVAETDPVEPSNPAEPVDPTNPVKPSEPEKETPTNEVNSKGTTVGATTGATTKEATTNTKATLPKAGSETNTVLWVCGILLIVGVGVTWILRKKKT